MIRLVAVNELPYEEAAERSAFRAEPSGLA
ncbi:hypothetical protein QFZ27_001526 [Inquilinus ginsengisoli]